jgi:hypothetical protein
LFPLLLLLRHSRAHFTHFLPQVLYNYESPHKSYQLALPLSHSCTSCEVCYSIYTSVCFFAIIAWSASESNPHHAQNPRCDHTHPVHKMDLLIPFHWRHFICFLGECHIVQRLPLVVVSFHLWRLPARQRTYRLQRHC